MIGDIRLHTFPKPDMAFLRAGFIHDRIENDIAIDAAQLVRKHHPADLELDTELASQRLAELKLKAAAIAGLAGEGKRVGIGAKQQGAAVQDRLQWPGIRNA